MKLAIFYNTANRAHKKEIMDSFAKTIKVAEMYFVYKLADIKSDTDVVITFTFFPKTDVANRRQYYLLREKMRFIHIDSDPLVGYPHELYKNYYFRITLGGIHRTEADKFICPDDTIDRWHQICRNKGLREKGWREDGNGGEQHILLLTQNNLGFAIQDMDINLWIDDTIREIRKYTERKIIVRIKPKTDFKFNAKKYESVDVFLSTNKTLPDDLKNCWATVSYNTTASFVGIFEGIPAFCLNPNSIVAEIASADLSKIEEPYMPTTEQMNDFYREFSYSVWNYNELISGIVWQRIEKYLG